jgi:dTMP kinase
VTPPRGRSRRVGAGRFGADSDPTYPLADAPDRPRTLIADIDEDRPSLHVRLFGSHQFFRLWLAQVVSAIGDWLGFLAIAILATQVGTNPDAAVAFVMAARLLPGFFLAPVAGVIVDRWNRKKVMVACDIGRAAVVVTLPFVDTLVGLVVASLLLEAMTLLWSPAKEASVPLLVPPDRLTSANSLSLGAAYGTFPVASLLFTLLAALSAALADVSWLDPLRLGREGALAFYIDAVTFMIAAFLISRLALPTRTRAERERARHRRIDWTEALDDLKEGWHVVFLDPTVRAVTLGLAIALIGGGMIVPLGPVFSVDVLDAGDAGFGAMITALGFGGAVGVLLVNAVQKRLPKTGTFSAVLAGAGFALMAAASSELLGWVTFFVFVMGMCAGASYVLGFTILHESVDEAMLGRTFGGLFTLVRFCLLISFVVGPFLSAFLGELSSQWVESQVDLPGLTVELPGVRLALWLAGLIIVGASFLARHSLRVAARQRGTHPSRPATPAPEAA